MLFGILADAIVVVHGAFIAFVVAGAWFVLRRPWLRWAHLPAVIWAVLLEIFGWTCPLTPLELWLRDRANQSGYATGFIEHYLWPVIYPAGLTRAHQIALAILVVVINVTVYVYGWRRRVPPCNGCKDHMRRATKRGEQSSGP